MGKGRYTWYGTPACDFFLNNNFFGPVPDFSDGIQLFTLSLSLSLLGEQVMEQLISQNFSP